MDTFEITIKLTPAQIEKFKKLNTFGKEIFLSIIKGDLQIILNEKFDICIIDTFPGVDTYKFIDSVKELCREVVVI